MACSKNDIGERIANLRIAYDLSQEELSKKLHVSREVVAKWENGTRDLKTEYSIAIADYFDVTCDWLLRGIKAENVAVNNKLGLVDEAITNITKIKEIVHLTIQRTQRKYTGVDFLNDIMSNEHFYYFVLSCVETREHLINHLLTTDSKDNISKSYLGVKEILEGKGMTLNNEEYLNFRLETIAKNLVVLIRMVLRSSVSEQDLKETKEYMNWMEEVKRKRGEPHA